MVLSLGRHVLAFTRAALKAPMSEMRRAIDAFCALLGVPSVLHDASRGHSSSTVTIAPHFRHETPPKWEVYYVINHGGGCATRASFMLSLPGGRSKDPWHGR